MAKQEFFYLGYVQKMHASDGRLKIKLDVDDPPAYQGLDALFIKIGVSKVPFFIEELSIQSNGLAIVALEDVDDPEQAEVLTGKEIYLPMEALPELKENQFYYHEIKGFKVIDKQNGELGRVEEVLEYPGQDLIQLFYNEKEVLIPINDDTIVQVDRAGERLFVQMPEGLLDVYLNSEENE